ncbi:uncharacterized protein BDCG_05643 [Blastomyces dermatitidis ER-3]|uniref:F-box domain-containing protein n=1 Tax=Ajellomyces dermatitidis (strain ER-3 / ATCC MYA-2586) TaxID=559297 RepID=A0ABP2F1Z7_AJEDR|nr:uncharacterized protein BDCG_05643 [Blastomyces dermatitidis ER-3]EEQ90523.1 hypothetical protein BDCG_05643 [Blastomyces dermatitidis ER-3]
MAPRLRPLRSEPREPSARPLRSTRKRVRTYREDSCDNDLSFLDDTDSYGSDRFCSSTRRRPLTYREDLAAEHLSEQLADAGAESGSTPPLLPGKVTRSSSARAKRSLFSKNSQQFPKTPSPKKQRQQTDSDATRLTPIGPIPPWQKLPYHILLNIFNHAFSPSTSPALSDLTKSVRWLLSTSRLCREFFEPAITTLYYSPPLFPPSRLSGLVHLLERPQETLYTNYRNKIKRLDILFRHYHVRHLDLGQLIALTPQLQHLRLHDATQLAMPPPMNVKQRLNTWEKFLDALDANNIRLRSWTWNGEFLLSSPRFQPQKIAAVHRRPAFTNLRSLHLLNLPPSSSINDNANGNNSDEDQAKSGELFASALSLLPGLQELEFSRCYSVDDNLLSYLDLNLRSLKLVNCENVTSANLGTFLARRGQSLRDLVLEHNRYLNMSFTADLAMSCPHLEAFTLDLNFTSPVSFTHDVDPYFDELLHDSEVPSWPASLQILKLERLRKWEISTAMLFFDSLIHSAPYLPNLRVLQLSAILEIGWRDRASFRREWVGKLERTYRRCSLPPNQRSRSTPEGQTAEGHTNRARSRSFSSTNKDLPARTGPRHSTRIAQQRSVETCDTERRIIAKKIYPQADSAGKEEFIHGMCDVVEIRVDNLRPADNLLTNDNFEDDDTGDEDWSGRDPVEVDRYAW